MIDFAEHIEKGWKGGFCKGCPYEPAVKVPYECRGQTFHLAKNLKQTNLVFVGESPGQDENKNLRPFVGRSGQVLNKMNSIQGIKREEITILNAQKCTLLKQDAKADKDSLARCKNYLIEALKVVRPKLIIVLGEIALKQILSVKRSVSSYVGNFYDFVIDAELTSKVFVTYHPAFILRGASKNYPDIPFEMMSMKEKIFYRDFQAIGDFIRRGHQVPEASIDTSDYIWGKKSDLVSLNKAEALGIDYETTAHGDITLFNPKTKLVSIAFSAEPGKSFVFPFEGMASNIKDKIKEILSNSKIKKYVAARPFEEVMTRLKLKVEMAQPVNDVLPMAQLVDENYRKYSLETVANAYTSLKNIKQLAKGMRAETDVLLKEDPEAFQGYAGVDPDATLRCGLALKSKILEDKKLARYYQYFLQPVQTMFAETAHFGMDIDIDILKKNKEELQALTNQLEAEALSLIPDKIRDLPEHRGEKKWTLTRADLIVDFMFRRKAGLRLRPKTWTDKNHKPSTEADHLKLFFDDHPFVALLMRWKKADKVLDYMENLTKYIYPNGKIYPTADFTRMRTGRIALLYPPIMTYPKRGEFVKFIRQAIVPESGWVMGERDLSQSEIRIIAWLAGETNILNALKLNIDIHVRTASTILEIPMSRVTEDDRQKGKSAGFGLIYLMSPEGFRQYAFDEYGVAMTMKEAEQYYARFFSRPDGYWHLPIYHAKQRFLVKKNGYVESPLGRKRRLPAIYSDSWAEKSEAERQAVNTPTQSYSSDFCLLGRLMFWDEIKQNIKFKNKVLPQWFIHDNNMFQAKEAQMDPAMGLLKECMEERAVEYVKKYFGVTVGYPVASDGKQGKNWFDMTKCK